MTMLEVMLHQHNFKYNHSGHIESCPECKVVLTATREEVRRAVAKERESCASLIEQEDQASLYSDLATKIRARGH